MTLATRQIEAYAYAAGLKDYYIIDSLTEASKYMAKMSKKKIAKKMIEPIKVKEPKKLPPGKYSGCVVDYDANFENPKFKIVAGPTQQEFQRTQKLVQYLGGLDHQAVEAVPLKTKADMLGRISYLEACIDQNNKRHEKALDTERLSTAVNTGKIYQRFAEDLLEAHKNGMKEGSLPRRS